MSDFCTSFDRQNQLKQETLELDKEVETIQKQQSFKELTRDIRTTRTESLKEINRFVSNHTMSDFISTNVIALIVAIFVIMLLIAFVAITTCYILVVVVFHVMVDVLSMCSAIFVISVIPSLLISTSICEEVFVKPNYVVEKLKQKTLSTGYEISKDIIDCPVAIKEWLYLELTANKLYLNVSDDLQVLNFYDENGKTAFEVIDSKGEFEKTRLNQFFYSKEFRYFSSQLTMGKIYKVADIIKDSAFR